MLEDANIRWYVYWDTVYNRLNDKGCLDNGFSRVTFATE